MPFRPAVHVKQASVQLTGVSVVGISNFLSVKNKRSLKNCFLPRENDVKNCGNFYRRGRPGAKRTAGRYCKCHAMHCNMQKMTMFTEILRPPCGHRVRKDTMRQGLALGTALIHGHAQAGIENKVRKRNRCKCTNATMWNARKWWQMPCLKAAVGWGSAIASCCVGCTAGNTEVSGWWCKHMIVTRIHRLSNVSAADLVPPSKTASVPHQLHFKLMSQVYWAARPGPLFLCR